jgi:hypothetical protein
MSRTCQYAVGRGQGIGFIFVGQCPGQSRGLEGDSAQGQKVIAGFTLLPHFGQIQPIAEGLGFVFPPSCCQELLLVSSVVSFAPI